jgi:uncharacterized protein GlcG (DUF336 family)
MRMLLALAGVAVSTAAQAQTAPPPGSPPSWSVRDSLSLPGDPLPPPLAAVIGPPPPINPNAPRTPVAGPPLALALQAAQAALAKCKADGFAVAVAVSNSVGGMVLGMQADGAFPGRIYNAARKNLVAIEFGTPNSAVRDRLRAGDAATLARIRPNMTLLPGAIPLYADGKLIGAIGVSGAPGGERDEVCAAAGAAVFAAAP